MKVLLYGGASILVWLLMTASQTTALLSPGPLRQFLILGGALVALFVYQPHFLSTYYLNYRRGKDFILQNKFSLVIFPVVLLVAIAVLCWFAFALNTPFAHMGLGWLLLAAFSGAAWHFAMQAVAAIGDLQSENKAPPSLNFIKAVRRSLVSVGLLGILIFLNLHGGIITLFGMQSPAVRIPSVLMTLAQFLTLLTTAPALWLAYKEELHWKAYVPWLAYGLWYLSPTFLVNNFFLVPVFHSLQYLPFFLRRIQGTSHGLWKIAALVVCSLIFVQLLPPLLDRWLVSQEKFQASLIFVSFLMFVNLHHFVMESITWKRARN